MTLRPRVVRPSTAQSWTAILCCEVLHPLLQLGSEVANKTLNGPGESLTKSYEASINVVFRDIGKRHVSLPQIVCPSTCFVNS